MDTLHFTTSINCGGCVAAVTPYLQSLHSVHSWHVDTDSPKKILTITGDNLQEDHIVETVEKAGFTIKRMEA
ncbi:MAG: heavy-metal-associated domain-containing protein [Candidatus Kapabacteria bacterium]|nr:heavy-metal-associated domain-containing protein [Candidatus Kapabacteria bacterium]